jgi:hypothetical protein
MLGGRKADLSPMARCQGTRACQPRLGESRLIVDHQRRKGRPGVDLPTAYRSEQEFVNAALDELGAWFAVDREVPGRDCTGRPRRLDAALRPHDPIGWKDPDPAFGVEFKTDTRRTFDTRDYTAWLAQAATYTHTEWSGMAGS